MHPQENSQPIEKKESAEEIVILTGPEGGFSKEEFNQARRAGFETWSLGPRILRAETAPIAGLSLLQNLWGDFENQH